MRVIGLLGSGQIPALFGSHVLQDRRSLVEAALPLRSESAEPVYSMRGVAFGLFAGWKGCGVPWNCCGCRDRFIFMLLALFERARLESLVRLWGVYLLCHQRPIS